jgi:4'-phosphopantetheinyl transferase
MQGLTSVYLPGRDNQLFGGARSHQTVGKRVSKLIQRFREDSSIPLINWSSLQSDRRELNTDEVHVWHALLDEQLAHRLEPVLSEEERTRADRFHFQKDRNHFIVARGMLRTILASYLNANPIDLRFCCGEKGKPALMNIGGKDSIEFNLAHSHGMALFAFSRNRVLGVDLEFIRNELAAEEVAEQFFSNAEVDALRSLSPEARSQAFFNCWTRKEAYIKARGEGLTMPLNEFDVSLVPGETAALLKNHKDPDEVSRWSMQSIPVEAGYVAALVAEGSDLRPKHFYLASTIG